MQLVARGVAIEFREPEFPSMGSALKRDLPKWDLRSASLRLMESVCGRADESDGPFCAATNARFFFRHRVFVANAEVGIYKIHWPRCLLGGSNQINYEPEPPSQEFQTKQPSEICYHLIVVRLRIGRSFKFAAEGRSFCSVLAVFNGCATQVNDGRSQESSGIRSRN